MSNVHKLISALRSGKYLQCRYALRKGEGFCVYGVAADLYIKEFPEKAQWRGTSVDVGDGKLYPYSLPKQIIDWAGLGTDGQCYVYEDERGHRKRTIASWNDDVGLNFKELARILSDANPPEGVTCE